MLATLRLRRSEPQRASVLTFLAYLFYIAKQNAKTKNLRCKQIDKAIKTMPWGEPLFYVKDPFNNLICFVDEATVLEDRWEGFSTKTQEHAPGSHSP
jgi:hypothetical protein